MDDLFSLLLTGREAPARTLRVQSFSGRERLSEPYRFDMVVRLPEDLEPLGLLGGSAVLSIRGPEAGPRLVAGALVAVRDQGHGAVRLRLAPRLDALRHRKNSRVFQDVTVPQIVDAVLDHAGEIPREWRAGGASRVYCVQYRETDLAFVHRLLAEEGIFYFFRHDEDGETLVFGDSPSTYDRLAALVYHPPHAGMARAEHHVHRFEVERALRTAQLVERAYDHARPHYDARGIAKDLADPEPLTHYEHDVAPMVIRRHAGVAPDAIDARAAVHLEQLRRRAWRAEGASGCPRLLPGSVFTLSERDELGANAQGEGAPSYVVDAVRHVGHAAETAGGEARYENTFSCAPAIVTLRPRPAPRRLREVSTTGIVVGPEKQEIHTDELGRIKVQLLWDREGGHDEKSSCWIRVVQSWAGAGWGAQFVPRVGMEVLITFLRGDVDEPVVVGCLSNGLNGPPFKLPHSATRSGWRTHTVGSEANGGNELSFDDRRGGEEVHVRAQRDLRIIVNNRASFAAAEEIAVVRGHRAEHLGSAETRVDGSVVLAADRVERVIAGDAVDAIGGKAALGAGARAVQIEKDDRQSIGGDQLCTVTGCSTMIVGTKKAPASWTTHATGAASLTADGAIEIAAEKGIVFRCGASEIRIGPGGVEIVAAAVHATDPAAGGGLSLGPKGLRLDTKGDVRIQAARLVAVTANASIDVHREVQIDGEQIRLNSPAPPEDAPEAPRAPTTVQLVDQDGNAVAGARFVLRVGDERRGGVLGKDGGARVRLEDGETATIAFPGHDVDGAPNKMLGPKTHVVRSGEHLARIAADLGLDADAVWNHPKNADLRALRKDMHILSENDVLWFEAVERGLLPLKTGAPNTFHTRIRFTETHLRLADADGKALAREAFEAEGEGFESAKGTTDGDGKLTVRHPSAARSCVVRVPRLGLALPLGLGDVDPADSISGAQQRLAGLGYAKGPASGEIDEATAAALLAFQAAQHIEPTGKLTPDTTEALVLAYGC